MSKATIEKLHREHFDIRKFFVISCLSLSLFQQLYYCWKWRHCPGLSNDSARGFSDAVVGDGFAMITKKLNTRNLNTENSTRKLNTRKPNTENSTNLEHLIIAIYIIHLYSLFALLIIYAIDTIFLKYLCLRLNFFYRFVSWFVPFSM